MGKGKVKKSLRGPAIIVKGRSWDEPTLLPVAEVRKLGLQCLIDQKMDSKLFYIHKMSAVRKWVVLYLPRAVPALDEKFAYGATTLACNSYMHPMEELGRLHRSSKAGKRDMHKFERKPAKTATCTLEQVMASSETLASRGYPQQGLKLDTQPGTGDAYAIDCEMCLSGSTSVLTRVAVVRFADGEVLLDELVKPSVEITNYLTPYSGITPEMLEDVKFTLDDVQAWLRAHIGQSDYLIGHSLDNDLKVLQVQHDRIVDTVLLYPHYRGLPYRCSLKYLAKVFLGRDIQQSAVHGHDPTEDARTCEQLVKPILENGIEFGNERLRHPAISSVLSASGLKTTIIGPELPQWDALGSADHILEPNAAKCVDTTVKAISANPGLVCCSLSDCETLDDEVRRLMSSLPEDTLVTAVLGADPSHLQTVSELQRKRREYQAEYAVRKWDEIENPWTTEDANRLHEADRLARRGRAYFMVTFDTEKLADLPMSIKDNVLEPPVFFAPTAPERRAPRPAVQDASEQENASAEKREDPGFEAAGPPTKKQPTPS